MSPNPASSGRPHVEAAPNANLAFATTLFEEWRRAGLAHVCVCPGSRSAPLAIAAAHSGLATSVHLDERSGAFFAQGLARASRAPVALLCTSGTAAVNFAPAVVEAHHARVPLLVLTADRPPELREWGAGQTIDQTRLFGTHVRWYAEAPLPEASPAGLRHARALASRAFALASGPPAGPVHLNLPFRDPLDPRRVDGEVPADLAASDLLAARGRPGRAYTELRRGQATPSPDAIASLAERAAAAERGVVVCGPADLAPDGAAAIASLARRLGWPLLAEPTSQLRTGAHVGEHPPIATAHWLLSDARFAGSHAPDFVLRFGAAPTSKALARWLARHADAEQIAVDPDALWHDPDHLVGERHVAEPGAFCSLLERRLPERATRTSWLEGFERAEALALGAIEAALVEDDALLEPRAIRELASGWPSDAPLYVSNSMPVRDLDALWPAAVAGPRVLCNRGANGIDGMVSSALGAAAAATGPVALLTGDLALLHDVSGLLAAQRMGRPLVVVVLDNDGGGIFSMLPVAAFGEAAAFDAFFRTPHGHDLAALCAGAGVPCTRVSSWPHFHAALKDALARPGPSAIVVPTDADASVAWRRDLAARVGRALAEAAA